MQFNGHLPGESAVTYSRGREDRTFLRNSLANAMNGASGALLTLAVPPVLARMLRAEAFSAWTLVLQLAAYASYLNFGIQGGVSRYVASTARAAN